MRDIPRKAGKRQRRESANAQIFFPLITLRGVRYDRLFDDLVLPLWRLVVVEIVDLVRQLTPAPSHDLAHRSSPAQAAHEKVVDKLFVPPARVALGAETDERVQDLAFFCRPWALEWRARSWAREAGLGGGDGHRLGESVRLVADVVV